MKEQYIFNMINAMALGDSFGFPYENMSPDLINKIKPELKYPLNFNKIKNTITDDTEHLVMTYLALLDSQNSQHIKKDFERSLSKRLRTWFLTLPAGIGMATLKSLSKLTIGISPSKTGVFSAGNGPLMRAPIIGAFYFDNEDLRKQIVHVSTTITHTDPLAELASHSVADIVAFLINNKENESCQILDNKDFIKKSILNILRKATQKVTIDEKITDIWQGFIRDTDKRLSNYESYQKWTKATFPKGISGFSLHTLQAIIAQIYYHNTIKEVVISSVYSGGDTDTTAGISASVISIISNPVDIPTNIIIEKLKRPYPIKIFNSFISWIRSIFSLWRFIYIFL